ncbi:MAG: S24 family peptidase [Patescibacteria group bacterium]
MHIIQQKLLNLAENNNLADLTLRKMGELIQEPGSPQKIKHHYNQLISKGILVMSANGQTVRKVKRGLDDKSKIVSLPIHGSVNCGQALLFADNNIEGYLKVSLNLLNSNLANKIQDLFVLKAVGNSMNRASINGRNIEDGDFVIIDHRVGNPKGGEYVVSVIEGAANIKKFYPDIRNHQIMLLSESNQDYPPIYIHLDDYSEYLVCGRVVDVMKKPDELELMRNASAQDILSYLGPISREEVDYYKNL